MYVTIQSSYRFFTSRFRQFLDSDQKHSYHRYFIDPRHIRYSHEKASYLKLYKKTFYENRSADFTELHTHIRMSEYQGESFERYLFIPLFELSVQYLT